MLSVTDLLTLERKPKMSHLSLLTIQQFYKEHLCGRRFIYSTDDPHRPTIRLRFKEEELCHLLGFQHIFEKQRFGSTYIGESGYNLMRSGELTFDFIKETNEEGLKQYENRMLFFPFVHQILKNPDSVIFDPKCVPFKTKLQADLIFYNEQNRRYLHLFLDHYKKRPGNYFPRSFFDRRDNKLLVGQAPVTVTKTDIILD
ncbi:PBECR4 domain-containing protein [Bacillus wiedmannii]|uniref:PBECR4 domain-containing protein n=1 Tax=Bacillus wiedmannii TaxID=1890302 RepID=UPI0021D1ACF1|nr:PBECR4 domain-containing protein [Bacillus wiedmannii]MCU5096132.1 PBECR4 domain-containing protein [Bacillus wiedmannii]